MDFHNELDSSIYNIQGNILSASYWDDILGFIETAFKDAEIDELPYYVGEINGIEIYIIDGDEVKTKFDMNYVEGGNDEVYDFIPDNTIWIDAHIDPKDYKYIALHEFVERYLISEFGLKYDDAYDHANEIEKEYRRGQTNWYMRDAFDW